MDDPQIPLHELKFAFSDFLKLLKRHKKLVFFSMLFAAIVCFLFAVSRPVHFLIQATFRDKGKTQASIRSSVSDLLLSSGNSQESEAASTMKSRLLISRIVKKLNQQGRVVKAETRWPEIENAYDNLLSEWAYWWSIKTPILEELDPTLVLKNIQYKGEVTNVYFIAFQDQNHFTIKNSKGEDLKPAALGELIQDGDIHFEVHQQNKNPLPLNETYIVVLSPMSEVTAGLGGNLVIDVDRENKSLLRLQFKDRDRHFGANFVNALMDAYQYYLVDEHELTSNVQVDYLTKRQKEVGDQLEKLMEDYVQNASDDMSQSGFTSLQREMDFLATNLANNQQKLTELDFEIKRLNSLRVDDCVHYDSYTGRGDPAIINQLLTEMRLNKQQADALELAIQNLEQTTAQQAKVALDENYKAVEKTRTVIKEAEQLVATLQGKRKEPLVLKALDSQKYPVSTWYGTYKTKEKAWVLAPFGSKADLQEDFFQFRDHFINYLDTFQRMMTIQLATLEQRMRTHQNPQEEFQGITLDTCRNLYVTYVRELNDLQASEKQHRFIVDQLKNPEFELSSLTALLHDPISHERIQKSTQIMIALKDDNNHTQKELDRLKDELTLQKTFLSSHINQMADLLSVKQDLLSDKIKALQGMSLDLTHQQISLLRKQLSDYLETRLDNLTQEKKLLKDHQAALHARMAAIPTKWASEQILNQNLAMQQRFMENLAHMVESKNITKNLEMVQSAPLDIAISPVNPKPPRLLFYTIFGALLGFLGASCFLFTRTMIRGIPASVDNLRLSNFHTSGYITPFQGDEITATTPLLDTDLDTLRRLVAHYEKDSPKHREAQKLLIVNGKGPDFSNTLAKLLSKKGQRAIKLQLNFKNPKEPKNGEGLIQYLEGQNDMPQVESFDGFDKIAAGGASRYSEELLRSPRFVELLEKLKPSYDWIIGVSPVKIPSAEAENLAKLFDGTIVVVTDETLQDLIAFSNTLDDQKKDALTFVFDSRVK